MNASDPKLDALIKAVSRDLLDEDLELFHSIDTSKTKMSDKAIKRIRRKIRNYDRESWWSSVPLACRRAVAAVLVICSILFGLCMSVSAVRAEIVNTVMKWYDKFAAVFYVTEQTPPSVIEEYREPMLQLAGTERQVFQQAVSNYIVMYLIDEERFMLYQQMTINHNSAAIDNENCMITDIKIGEYDAKLFEYETGMRKITWHDNEYAYIISLDPYDIETDVLIRVAESVK